MTTQTIEIIIEADGKVTSMVVGVRGPSCTALTEFLDKLGKVTLDEHTAEFYEGGDALELVV